MSESIRCPSCGAGIESGEETSCSSCGVDLGGDTTIGDGHDSDAVSRDDKLAAQLKRALEPRIQVLRRYASGGMSVVYLGRDPALQRLVAIKVLARDLSKDPVARARFTREAESAAAIVDPHVVDIYQVGALPRTRRPYIVMQFVDGLTLQQEIFSGKLVPEALAKAVVGEVASALATAHARGVVHRDIKPANVVLDQKTRRAVVLDFGISAALKRPDAPGAERLTREGVSVGTPAYMSPEQAAAKEVTDRSDVYSLGVVAFEFVTGKLPFTAETPEGYLAAHLQDTPPDVTTLRPDIDKQFTHLINRCLAKNPEERPAAVEVARALIPSARVSVEWPPPGLEALRTRGWSLLRSLLTTAFAALAFFALLILPPSAGAGWDVRTTGVLAPLTAPGPSLGGTAVETMWPFLLMTVMGVTALLAAFSLFRAWRLADLLKWARALGYPWAVLLDVALDGPDTAALMNGYGVFALASETKRRRLLMLNRWSACAIVLAVALTAIGAILWAVGFGNSRGPAGPTLVSDFEAALLFIPVGSGLLLAFLLTLPESLVRNRARRWRPFLPLSWSLPAVQSELVSGWLTALSREPVPDGGGGARWLPALAPPVAGGILGAILITVLALALTVSLTASRWTAASASLARDILADTLNFQPRQHALSLIASSARLPAFARPEEASDSLGVRSTLSDIAVAGLAAVHPDTSVRTVLRRKTRRSWWRELSFGLPAGARAQLEREAERPSLAVWRGIAYATSDRPVWIYQDGYEGVGLVDSDLPLIPHAEAMLLADDNEAAALLAMAGGDRQTALFRARENVGVGYRLLNDPVHGWLAQDVIRSGDAMLAEIGLFLGDRELLLEAAQLRDAIGPEVTASWRTVLYSASLMADPVGPIGLRVVSQTARLPFARWWAVAGVVPGFCGNAREVLFGVDGRRHETLARAGDAARDLPGIDGWVGLNQRWLDRWLGGDIDDLAVSAWLYPLRWIGLDKLVNRIGYCRGAAREMESAGGAARGRPQGP